MSSYNILGTSESRVTTEKGGVRISNSTSRGTSWKAVAWVKKPWHELFTGTSGTTGTDVKAVAYT